MGLQGKEKPPRTARGSPCSASSRSTCDRLLKQPRNATLKESQENTGFLRFACHIAIKKSAQHTSHFAFQAKHSFAHHQFTASLCSASALTQMSAFTLIMTETFLATFHLCKGKVTLESHQHHLGCTPEDTGASITKVFNWTLVASQWSWSIPELPGACVLTTSFPGSSPGLAGPSIHSWRLP